MSFKTNTTLSSSENKFQQVITSSNQSKQDLTSSNKFEQVRIEFIKSKQDSTSQTQFFALNWFNYKITISVLFTNSP